MLPAQMLVICIYSNISALVITFSGGIQEAEGKQGCSFG